MSRRPKTWWPSIRLALQDRSLGLCEGCGLPRGNEGEVHHRMLRSRGGGHGLENLIVLHVACHALAHAEPAWATRHGWMVHSWDDPALVDVVRCRGPQGCQHG